MLAICQMTKLYLQSLNQDSGKDIIRTVSDKYIIYYSIHKDYYEPSEPSIDAIFTPPPCKQIIVTHGLVSA